MLTLSSFPGHLQSWIHRTIATRRKLCLLGILIDQDGTLQESLVVHVASHYNELMRLFPPNT